MPLSVVTPSTGMPLSLADAKLQLRVSTTDDDVLITSLLSSVAATIEVWSRRTLLPTVFQLTMPAFGDCIWLPRSPLITVDSFTYLDESGVSQTVDASLYHVVKGQPDRIVQASQTNWPTVLDHPEAVTIEFTSGYADVASIPEMLVQAMRLELEQQFEEHDTKRAGAIESLCAGFRTHNDRAWQYIN